MSSFVASPQPRRPPQPISPPSPPPKPPQPNRRGKGVSKTYSRSVSTAIELNPLASQCHSVRIVARPLSPSTKLPPTQPPSVDIPNPTPLTEIFAASSGGHHRTTTSFSLRSVTSSVANLMLAPSLSTNDSFDVSQVSSTLINMKHSRGNSLLGPACDGTAILNDLNPNIFPSYEQGVKGLASLSIASGRPLAKKQRVKTPDTVPDGEDDASHDQGGAMELDANMEASQDVVEDMENGTLELL